MWARPLLRERHSRLLRLQLVPWWPQPEDAAACNTPHRPPCPACHPPTHAPPGSHGPRARCAVREHGGLPLLERGFAPLADGRRGAVRRLAHHPAVRCWRLLRGMCCVCATCWSAAGWFYPGGFDAFPPSKLFSSIAWPRPTKPAPTRVQGVGPCVLSAQRHRLLLGCTARGGSRHHAAHVSLQAGGDLSFHTACMPGTRLLQRAVAPLCTAPMLRAFRPVTPPRPCPAAWRLTVWPSRARLAATPPSKSSC